MLILLMKLLEQPVNNLKMAGFFIEAARIDGGRILFAEALPKFPAPPDPDETGTEHRTSDLRR